MNKAKCMQHFVWTGIYNNNSYSIEVTKSSNITSDNDINIMTNTEDSLDNKKKNKKENKTLVPLLKCMNFN